MLGPTCHTYEGSYSGYDADGYGCRETDCNRKIVAGTQGKI